LADVLAGVSARRLGKRLHMIAAQEFNGLTVKCIRQDNCGAIWKVARVVAHSHQADS
jgi:hypothetical protein